jgi:N6-L-threonylcarbamoyladenine synthase
MHLLGIETSCDETAVAVINGRGEVLSDFLASQNDLHGKYGGVVPELACRRHTEVLGRLIREVLQKSEKSLQEIEGIAVTVGPGLIGALLVGVSLAKSLGYALQIPVVPVHHLEGHISAVFLERRSIEYPAVALVVSGGHTNLYFMEKKGRYRLLGRTLDDAAGEALDKAAKMLSLGYPGGPVLDKLSRSGNPEKIVFPRPCLSSPSFDFSFSGLKTALYHYLSRQKSMEGIHSSLPDIAACYQEAIVDVLVGKSLAAVRQVKARTLVVAGGVAANSRLRKRLKEESAEMGIDLTIPSPRHCTDNGAMIAMAGLARYEKGVIASLDLNPRPDLELASL